MLYQKQVGPCGFKHASKNQNRSIYMKMKNIYLSMLTAATLGMGLSTTAAQAEDLSIGGDLGVASQYVWRGVPQTASKPAVQGDVGASLGGLSAGVWFSNAYGSTAPQFGGRDVVEFDWTLDYSGSIADSGVDYSVGYIGYTYLYDSAANFSEVNAGLSYGPVSLTGYYTVKDSKNKWYLKGDTWVDLGASTTVAGYDVSGTVSYAKWKKDAVNRAVVGGLDMFKSGINLVTLGVSKEMKAGDVAFTPSLTATIPVIKKASDGNRYIYGAAVTNEFVAAVNFAY